MRQFDPMYHLYDVVGCRIDDINRVASAVGDIDQRRFGQCWRVDCSSTYPFSYHKPVGIVLRVKLPAAGMKWIPARFRCQWMHQQSACNWISGDYFLQSALEVSLGLLFRPTRGAGKHGLEIKRSARLTVAAVASRVARPRLQENRLNLTLEKIEVQRVLLCRGRRLLLAGKSFADPIGNQPPFRVVLRFPEFTPGVRRITAYLWRKWMKE